MIRVSQNLTQTINTDKFKKGVIFAKNKIHTEWN